MKFLAAILLITAAVFAGAAKYATGTIPSTGTNPTLGNDRPFHQWVSDTGVKVGSADTLYFVKTAGSRTPSLQTSDFNKNAFQFNPGGATAPAPVSSHKDSIVCDVSMNRVDADASDLELTASVLDHGTTPYTVFMDTAASTAALARTRFIFPFAFSSVYQIGLTTITATDTIRIYRIACGDK